jgi:hypothetical protein
MLRADSPLHSQTGGSQKAGDEGERNVTLALTEHLEKGEWGGIKRKTEKRTLSLILLLLVRLKKAA